MVNSSKINDERFWKKWNESGAVGTIETASDPTKLKNIMDSFFNDEKGYSHCYEQQPPREDTLDMSPSWYTPAGKNNNFTY